MSIRVVLSGRTAAGKSTHARLLAEELAVPYVSATEILVNLVAERTNARRETRWQPLIDDARAADDSIDDELDSLMTETYHSHECGVFDAALLPWIAPDVQAVRVWLESDLPSRLRKCVVSHLNQSIGLAVAAERVARKDAFTEDRLVKTRGCLFDPTTAVFDVIADNGSLIPEATVAAAAAGISAFQPVLLHAVKYAAGLDSDPPTSPWISLHD